MHFAVHERKDPSPGSLPVEVVERKGIGHPDTICDGIAERVSRDLCRHYLERFGAVLHHNVDKVLLVGGASSPRFGGGAVTEPIEIYVAGRATSRVGRETIPVERMAERSARAWLAEHVGALDVERHVRVLPRLRQGSGDLTALFARGAQRPLANDTSCGAGFAPLSTLERVVLAAEAAINSAATKAAHPALGTDVKIMGTRVGDQIRLTVGCAIVAAHTASIAHYQAHKRTVAELSAGAAKAITDMRVEVLVNGADDTDRGDVFLTVTGTSAEAGDDGEVGRGNRANGLITPYRPMTLEAAAGKNPVTHVGKLYNVVATRIAEAVVTAIAPVTDAECVLVSQIGAPVDLPQLVDLTVRLSEGAPEDHTRRIREIVGDGLSSLDNVRQQLLEGHLTVY